MNFDIPNVIGKVTNQVDQALNKGLRRVANDIVETSNSLIRAEQFGVHVFDKATKALRQTFDAAALDAQALASGAQRIEQTLGDGTKLILEVLKDAIGDQARFGQVIVESKLGGKEILNAGITCQAPGSAFGSNSIDELWNNGTQTALPGGFGSILENVFGALPSRIDSPLAALAERGQQLAGGAADPGKFLDQIKNLGNVDVSKFGAKDLLDVAAKAVFCPGPSGGLAGVGNKTLETLAQKILDALRGGAATGSLGSPAQCGVMGLNALRQLMAMLQNAISQNNGIPPHVLPGFDRPGGLPGFQRPDFELTPRLPVPFDPIRPTLPTRPTAPTTSIGNDDFKSGVLSRIRGIDGQIDSIKSALASGKVSKEDMLTLQLELQELQELKRQLVEMLTSTMKSEHDTNMAVIRNLAV